MDVSGDHSGSLVLFNALFTSEPFIFLAPARSLQIFMLNPTFVNIVNAFGYSKLFWMSLFSDENDRSKKKS
jgi:hypothetical protein